MEPKNSFNATILSLSLMLLAAMVQATAGGDLKIGFYKYSCPKAESIIQTVLNKYLRSDITLAPTLLRMHFHDCFVQGCDGSILLNATSSSLKAEKDAIPNLTLRGFNVIDAIKSALEAKCPKTVSCADILAVVARDSVTKLGGPCWKVPLGRRDGFTSNATKALTLPPQSFNFTQLKTSFANRGLGVKDLVVLSGGHTIGFSHCSSIAPRLYNFSGRGDTDPSLDPKYAITLKKLCKPTDTTTKIPMDLKSQLKFDNHYYTGVLKHVGLFTSDQALLTDPVAKKLVQAEALKKKSSNFPFFEDFAESMIAMSKINLLTKKQGEIRTKCAFVNKK